jgi:dolichol-phosphate hexosyltransferase
MTKKFKKITLMVPCYNEEKGIPNVIKDVPVKKLKEMGYKIEVLVINNNSTDKTAEVAKKLGARVVDEPRPGKGNAIKTGFKSIAKDVDFALMVDGDNTYKPHEMLRLIEPLESGFSDVIIGSRLEGNMKGKAMSFSHRLANWFFTFITRFFYGANVTDTCTGYFAWTRKAIDVLNGHIKAEGFAIEAEMITKMAKLGLRIHSVPITYDPRHGESKLAPISDGLKITWMLLKNIKWKPGK